MSFIVQHIGSWMGNLCTWKRKLCCPCNMGLFNFSPIHVSFIIFHMIVHCSGIFCAAFIMKIHKSQELSDEKPKMGKNSRDWVLLSSNEWKHVKVLRNCKFYWFHEIILTRENVLEKIWRKTLSNFY